MDKAKAGSIAGTVSIIVNFVLFTLKMWAGIVTGSLALTADAWHTMSDSLSSVVVVIASKLSSKKADKEHPFGHGRWELIASLFIAVMLGIVAYDFMVRAIAQFGNKEPVIYGTLAIIITIVSILAKEGLTQYSLYLYRKSGNTSIKADAWHHRSDALSSVVVLVGILFARRFWWIDSALGFIIALMIFYVTFEIIKDVINKFLGEDLDSETKNEIKSEIAKAFDRDFQTHHFHIHNYISHKELTFHIRLNNEMSIQEGHHIATKIEELVREKFGLEATLHIEPETY